MPVTIGRHSTHRASQRPIGFADVAVLMEVGAPFISIRSWGNCGKRQYEVLKTTQESSALTVQRCRCVRKVDLFLA